MKFNASMYRRRDFAEHAIMRLVMPVTYAREGVMPSAALKGLGAVPRLHAPVLAVQSRDSGVLETNARRFFRQ